MGMPSGLEVRARPDAIMRAARILSERIKSTDPAVVRFAEPVNGITSSSTAVRSISDIEGAAPGPKLAGGWTCTTGAGAVTNCDTGVVRTAAFTPSVPFESGKYYEIRLNPEHSRGITDLAGNPFDRDVVGFTIDP